MTQKQILPPNIRADSNCQPTWVTQNAIHEEQELILLGGGHYSPPPYRHRVNWLNFCIEKTIETTTVWKQGKQQLDFNFQSMFDKIPENDGVPRGPNGEKLCCCKRIDGVCQEDPSRSNRCCKTVSINYIIMIFISVMGKNHFICPLAFRRF